MYYMYMFYMFDETFDPHWNTLINANWHVKSPIQKHPRVFFAVGTKMSPYKVKRTSGEGLVDCKLLLRTLESF